MSRATADNIAWQHVIVAGDAGHPTPCHMIGRTTGVSLDRVLAMVGRYSAMKCAGIEPTGDWWADRVNVQLPQGNRLADRPPV